MYSELYLKDSPAAGILIGYTAASPIRLLEKALPRYYVMSFQGVGFYRPDYLSNEPDIGMQIVGKKPVEEGRHPVYGITGSVTRLLNKPLLQKALRKEPVTIAELVEYSSECLEAQTACDDRAG